MKYPAILLTGLIFVLSSCSSTDNAVSERAPAETIGNNSAEQKAEKLFQRAWKLMQQEEYGSARGKFRKITKKYSGSSLAAAAQFGLGETYYKQRKYKKAFKAYGKLIDEYPSFPDMEKALERQFEIAGVYYNNKPKKMPVLPVKVPAKRKPAIEYYEQMIAEAPFSHYAEQARYRIGRIYGDYNNHDEAMAAYEKFLEEFPHSELVPDVLYRLGRCCVAKTFGRRYDELSLKQAVIMFNTYLRRYPDGEKADEVKRTLAQLSEEAAYGNYRIARFYDDQKKYQAAKIYYLEIVKEHPDTKWAEIARARIQVIDSNSTEKPEK